jgi:hypothetical protein
MGSACAAIIQGLPMSFVALAPNHEFAESGALECEPGCLQSGYPYGLPRLTKLELAARFRRFRGDDSAE